VVAPWAGWISPYDLGYPDDSDDGVTSGPPNDSAEGYDAQPADQEPQAFPRFYQPTPAQSSPPLPSASEEAVTLVFKDGRPTEQIHNYILSRSTLYVLDQSHRVIPTDLLDLTATAKVNHDAGVDFQLPIAPK
jgi:hypothetical protein